MSAGRRSAVGTQVSTCGFWWASGAGCHPRAGQGREAEPYPEHGQTVAFDDRSELEHLAQSSCGVPQGPGGSAGVCGWRAEVVGLQTSPFLLQTSFFYVENFSLLIIHDY